MQSPLPPFEEVRLVPQLDPDGAGLAGNQRTQPFETNGKGFAITVRSGVAIPATTVVQVNNSSFLKKGAAGYSVHPIASYINNTQEDIAARIAAALNPEFDNYWVTLAAVTAATPNTTGYFSTNNSYRYVRIIDTAVPLDAALVGFPYISPK